MIESIREVLIRRDKLTSEEATDVIDDLREALYDAIDNGGDPEEIMRQEVGLEPDYLMDAELGIF